MSFLLISVGKRVGGESINEDNIFTYKKIFVLVLSTASYLVQAGIPLYVVSQILSHKSVATTQRYAHLATENLKDALETLSQRLSS